VLPCPMNAAGMSSDIVTSLWLFSVVALFFGPNVLAWPHASVASRGCALAIASLVYRRVSTGVLGRTNRILGCASAWIQRGHCHIGHETIIGLGE